ncbi:hypothetical protein F441_13063 [Phytophthora nicotianae CJ01A1]|uniref:Uncharacterized protein n=1 Tax=Phytophthora nicotianae CJ01A1 TaxID=1317063 RepID=W2WM34_PHYNI|nr:hypothetical protein F441_13063 [Phytophthora nicotianae CJ01A1]
MEYYLHRYFNPVDDVVNDDFRSVLLISRDSTATGMSPAMWDLGASVKVTANMVDPDWIPTRFNFLRSKPGGTGRESHTDFPNEDLASARAKSLLGYLLALVALQEGTKMRIFPGGDLVHNGVSFEKLNYRVHCYLSYKAALTAPENVQNTLLKHVTCQYCGAKDKGSQVIRNYRKRCKTNPQNEQNRKTRKLREDKGEVECELWPGRMFKPSYIRSHKEKSP